MRDVAGQRGKYKPIREAWERVEEYQPANFEGVREAVRSTARQLLELRAPERHIGSQEKGQQKGQEKDQEIGYGYTIGTVFETERHGEKTVGFILSKRTGNLERNTLIAAHQGSRGETLEVRTPGIPERRKAWGKGDGDPVRWVSDELEQQVAGFISQNM